MMPSLRTFPPKSQALYCFKKHPTLIVLLVSLPRAPIRPTKTKKMQETQRLPSYFSLIEGDLGILRHHRLDL